jgi:peptidoglycan/xylan/chitin deacetylase (PgdA/CDA1 family)
MSTSLSLISQHIATIQKCGYEIVPSITREENQVMICFDDGFRGVWDNREFFIQHNIRPTIFIAVSLIGKEGYLSVDEIKELMRYGFIFESHSWSHTNLTKFSAEELQRELKGAKDELERILDVKMSCVCFPQGYYSDDVIRISKDSGYTLMFISEPNSYYSYEVEGVIPRYLIQDVSPSVLRGILRGGMDVWQPHYRKIHKL